MKAGDCFDTCTTFPLKKDSLLLGLYFNDGHLTTPKAI